MTIPLIPHHDHWDGLIADLSARPEWAGLRHLPRETAQAVLAAPAALALWIARCAPPLAAAPRLRLLVIGAETVDAADQGRWYGILPDLLGAGFQIEATLVGNELDSAFASSAAHIAPPAAARCVCASLSEFLGRADAPDFDLAAVFHPGLQKNRAWLTDGSFARLVAAGVPLIASSYETDEFEMDRWVLECHGYGVAGDALVNPLYLELGEADARVRWGRALWRFSRDLPAAGARPDGERLAALEVLTRMVMHSMNTVGASSFNPGARVELRAGTGARLGLIHIFDQRFVDPASRKLWLLTAGGELQAAGEIGTADLQAYPGPAARDIERAVWAARIKAERLLPDYPRADADAGYAERAAGMLAAMRERAARMLRK